MTEAIDKFIKDFLKNKKILIAVSNGPARVSIRKFLNQFGVNNTEIEQIDDHSMVLEHIDNNKLDIVFSDILLQEKSFELLLERFQRQKNWSFYSVFFVIAQEKSFCSQSSLLNAEIDGYLFRPYNLDELKVAFVKSIKFKKQPQTYVDDLKIASDLLNEGSLLDAQEVLERATRCSKRALHANYLLAKCLIRLKKRDQAYQALISALELFPLYFPALKLKLSLDCEAQDWQQANEVINLIEKNLGIIPDLLPNLLRVAVQNQDYQKIFNYQQQLKEEPLSDEIKPYLATGLIFSGKAFLDQVKIDDALKCFRAAAQYALNRVALISKIINILVEAQLKDEVEKIITDLEHREALDLKQLRLIELEAFSSFYDAGQVLQMADRIIKEGYASEKTWEIMIAKSKELGRKTASIDELISSAQKAFPNYQFH